MAAQVERGVDGVNQFATVEILGEDVGIFREAVPMPPKRPPPKTGKSRCGFLTFAHNETGFRLISRCSREREEVSQERTRWERDKERDNAT